MKQLVLCLLVVMASSFLTPVTTDLSPKDRKFAVDYYIKTKERLLKDVGQLTSAQLAFKPDSSRWSITQCIEHIALAEDGLWQWCMLSLKSDTLKKPETAPTNEQLIAGVTDRTKKAQAPEMLQPKDQFPDAAAALKAFVERRDSTIQYLKGTTDPLKEHFMPTPAGTIDVFQGLLLLAAHSERHTLQIEEVMKSPGFPSR
ncbi:DinB family protein [Niabella beijingensis]|uniref:DinB family protein n=1 Tax=Niabella beijingensis TaxID=2872700 RepID=UPI001CBFACBE|nr:DinB family protein [Niabella beijingensis]MBZ4191134.1 DinB family protein [Niabella beijingensis]